ncbi:hypothetical protein AeNC1_016936, partial [Aphanomyces euteiches]
MRLLLTVAVALIALTTALDPSSKTRQLASVAPGDESGSPTQPPTACLTETAPAEVAVIIIPPAERNA